MIQITLKSHFWRKKKRYNFCCYVRNVVIDVIMFPKNLLTTSGLSILLHGVISDATSCDKAPYMLPLATFKYLNHLSFSSVCKTNI